MSVAFKQLDPNTITREDWKKYHEFRRIKHLETTPDDPYQPDAVIEKGILQDYRNDTLYVRRYVIYDSEESHKSKQIGSIAIIAFTEKNPSYEGNKHMAQFDISILKDYRNKGIATKSLHYLIEFAKDRNLSLLITQTLEDDGRNFLTRIGANLALAGKENRLQMKEVNWKMVKEWVAEAESLNPTTRIIQFSKVPDDLIEQYCKIFTEIMNQQPFGELEINDMIFTPELLRKREEEFNELGFTTHTMITVEQDGEISGLTEMIRMPEKKTMLNQGLTGVKDKHRGRKLGKWLKGLNLLEMKELYPEVTVVTTGNADSNAPMLSINHRLGFKPHRESTLGQIKLADLEKYYNQKILLI